MKTSDRVVFNTAVLYVKIVVSMLISLVSVRLVLQALGESDYGLYNLVAGVIAMLSFLNVSMSVSTQRFLSVAMGEHDTEKLNGIFNTGVCLHLLIGAVVALLFEAAAPFLFNGFLNIEPDRIPVAKTIYQFLVVSTFFSILSVPYGAVLNAKENMLALSVIGIVESLLKLALALYLLRCPFDRLVTYGLGTALLAVGVTGVNRLYLRLKYKEFSFRPRRYVRKEMFRQMLGFAGWNTLGSVAVIGRNQGTAVIVNLFYGTVVNAAYGIANQVNGVLNMFSNTLQTALNPQLMQSEGMRDRERLVRISFTSSKFCVFILTLFALPLILEMPYVLRIWLKDVPDYTLRMSQLMLLLSIVYQYSTGLMSSIQAVGKIRGYFLVMSTLILLNLPACYFLMKAGLAPYWCVVSFLVIEAASLVARLVMGSRLVGFRIRDYLTGVMLPTLGCMAAGLGVAVPVHLAMGESFLRLVLVCAAYACVYLLSVWHFGVNAGERATLRDTGSRFLHLFRRS